MNETMQPTALTVTNTQMSAMQVCEQFDKLQKIGEVISRSGILGAVTPSAGVTAALTCAQEGLSILQFKSKYHVHEDGNLSIKSRYVQAEFRRRGGSWTIRRLNNEVCDMIFHFNGQDLPATVTLEQFKKNGVALNAAGKLKNTWNRYPADMLFARCCASYIRKLCPEADGGMYTTEEVNDFRTVEPSAPTATVSPSPLRDQMAATAAATTAAADPHICTVKKSKIYGQRFDDQPTEILKRVMESKSEHITEASREVIRELLAQREEAARAAAAAADGAKEEPEAAPEAITPEVVG